MPLKDKEAAKQYNKDRYNDLKSLKICVSCGRRDAFNGQIYCPECIERNNESKAKYRASKKGREHIKRYEEQNSKKRSAKYYERKLQGLCVSCGKPQCKGSTRFCIEHLAQARRYAREQNRKRRMKNTKTLDELRAQRSEVSREAVKKTHLTEGWFKSAHSKKPKFCFGRLVRGVL